MSWRLNIPRKFQPLLRPARYKGLYGGRGGMKSHFFAELLIQRCVDRPTRAVCIREVQKSLNQSVKQLLEDKIKQFGYGSRFRILNNSIEPTNGGLIMFQGMQSYTADNIKSLEGMDIAWVEEAQALSAKSLTMLRPTIRKDGSEIWFSWNPQFETDPVDVFLRKDQPPDMVLVETSYKDNPHLPETLRKEAEWDWSHDVEKAAHVWGGKYQRNSEARIFKNWRVEDVPEPPRGTAFLLGGDWGFATDPTCLMRSWFDRTRPRTLIIDHEVWEVGCEIEDTPDLWDGLLCNDACPRPRKDCERDTHGWARAWRITGDSARPETISHMRRHGYPRLQPAKKGPNSVEEGVKFLQGYDIIVDPRCVHTIDELTFYSYKVDELTGQVLPIIADKKNHVIDSLRYATEDARRMVKKGGLVA